MNLIFPDLDPLRRSMTDPAEQKITDPDADEVKKVHIKTHTVCIPNFPLISNNMPASPIETLCSIIVRTNYKMTFLGHLVHAILSSSNNAYSAI